MFNLLNAAIQFDHKISLLFGREWGYVVNIRNLCYSFHPTFCKQYLEFCYPSGIPETPDIIDLPAEVHSDEVALKWTKPSSNGADIRQYTVYIRNVNSNDTVGYWRKLEVIYDVVAREYVVTLKNDQQYELVVTATNKYGESFKEQHKIKRIRVLGGTIIRKQLFISKCFVFKTNELDCPARRLNWTFT